MRNILNFNKNWLFVKDTHNIKASEGILVDLPHTWNATDGQDGGNDYFRGTCLYKKTLNKQDLPQGDRHYLEFCGANSSAHVYIGGEKLACHEGGYSTFRVDITDHLQAVTEIAVLVDNAPNEQVYPQMADFTFYGGLYRNVNLISVSESHFDLDYYGAPGIAVTPELNGADTKITVNVYVKDQRDGQVIRYTLYDREKNVLQKILSEKTQAVFHIQNVHLWNGLKDPYLYSCQAEILKEDTVLDNVCTCFGCRTFQIDPQRGFILNGSEYPLRGVSRHQDKLGIGNALLPCDHEEDMELILELGATTVRLAHYQHDQYFYDLCDRKGLVVWAEIPYISKHLPTARENTVSQMKELVLQNYNHPSIVVWGLSNEISIGGSTEDLLENHRALNDLVHELDKSRPTVIAAVSMCKMDDPYLQIPDAVSYNHYFGWYGGDTGMNGPWFDEFHAMHPKIPIGCSEYGCEALNWHTSNPCQGDYSEEYQAYYHEELIKQLFSRKYLWATHVWNMFDFGADARNEGGENGQNHKGLVTMDRKYKKDAFYAYKAWLRSPSDEPFVHLCGKRYVDRVEDLTKVTVYSNLPEVELFRNGESLGKKSSPHHFFYFEVPNKGESVLVAKAGDCLDESKIRKVEKMNESYLLREAGAILNWFDVAEKDGYFSINHKISEILESEEGRIWFEKFSEKLQKARQSTEKGSVTAAGFDIDMKEMMGMIGGFSILRMASMWAVMGLSFTKEELLEYNDQLCQIKKPPKK